MADKDYDTDYMSITDKIKNNIPLNPDEMTDEEKVEAFYAATEWDEPFVLKPDLSNLRFYGDEEDSEDTHEEELQETDTSDTGEKDEDGIEEDDRISITYGEKRRTYLRENKPEFYKSLLEKGELENHLKSIDKEAWRMEETMVERTCELRGVNAELKMKDMMEWAAEYKTIVAEVRGFVLRELIYS